MSSVKKNILGVAFFACFLSLFLWGAVKLDWRRGKEGGCSFCSKEILETQLVFRGREVLALATHKPAVAGHLLILPMRHVERFEQLTPSEIAEMGEMVQRADKAIKGSFFTTGSILVQKNGPEAGQSVPHVHIHYLPCSKKEGPHGLAIRFFLASWLKPQSHREMLPTITRIQESDGRED